jgi:hypothetical protein
MSIINHLFEAPHSVVKHLNAPLLKEREQYLSFLKANGRNKIRLQAVAGCLLHISRALGTDGLRPVALDEVRAAGRRWATAPERECPTSGSSREWRHAGLYPPGSLPGETRSQDFPVSIVTKGETMEIPDTQAKPLSAFDPK